MNANEWPDIILTEHYPVGNLTYSFTSIFCVKTHHGFFFFTQKIKNKMQVN